MDTETTRNLDPEKENVEVGAGPNAIAKALFSNEAETKKWENER